MKKCIALLIFFTLNSVSLAYSFPPVPVPSNINSWKGIIFNQNSAEAIVTYGICEFTPADTQHKAVVCPQPFYTETIAMGQHLAILIPNDLLDAQGKVITHYTASITYIKSDGLKPWQPEPGVYCVMDISKTLNAIMITPDGTLKCESGTVNCKNEQCQPSDYVKKPLKQ